MVVDGSIERRVVGPSLRWKEGPCEGVDGGFFVGISVG